MLSMTDLAPFEHQDGCQATAASALPLMNDVCTLVFLCFTVSSVTSQGDITAVLSPSSTLSVYVRIFSFNVDFPGILVADHQQPNV